MLEQLAVAILQVELRRPAETLGIRHGQAVAIVDLPEQEGIGRIGDEAAEHAGHGIAGQHGTHAGAAAGDDEIGSFGVQQDAGQQAVHDVRQRGFVLGRVHAVVMHRMTQRFDHGLQRVVDDLGLCGLAVLDDERDFHGIFSA
jgi:hypothetical protein